MGTRRGGTHDIQKRRKRRIGLRPRLIWALAIATVLSPPWLRITYSGPEDTTQPPSWAELLAEWAETDPGVKKDGTTGYPVRVRRIVDQAEMVLVSRKEFAMGIPRGTRKPGGHLLKLHEVTVAPFYMDVHEVTRARFRAFLVATGRDAGGFAGLETADTQPVSGVTHPEACAYANWVKASLPTEAQWECAARGGTDGNLYPWGMRDDTAKRNGPGSDDGFAQLAPVGSFPPNAYGIFDLAGNVAEWCKDWYDLAYYPKSPRRDPAGPSKGVRRVVRGGAWDGSDAKLMVFERDCFTPGSSRVATLGFRCVRAMPRVGGEPAAEAPKPAPRAPAPQAQQILLELGNQERAALKAAVIALSRMRDATVGQFGSPSTDIPKFDVMVGPERMVTLENLDRDISNGRYGVKWNGFRSVIDLAQIAMTSHVLRYMTGRPTPSDLKVNIWGSILKIETLLDKPTLDLSQLRREGLALQALVKRAERAR